MDEFERDRMHAAADARAAKAAYDRASMHAWAEYLRAIAPAKAEYERATADAKTAHDRARAPASKTRRDLG